MLQYLILITIFSTLTQAIVIPVYIKQQLNRLNTTISDRSCLFYKEFEKLIPCGNDGYTLQFAHHYCEVYLESRRDFSDRAWQDATRHCLQKKLYDYINKQYNYPSCKIIQQFGFDSHPTCYEKPDETKPKVTFCDIPFKDKVKIAWKAGNGALMQILRGAIALKFCL